MCLDPINMANKAEPTSDLVPPKNKKTKLWRELSSNFFLFVTHTLPLSSSVAASLLSVSVLLPGPRTLSFPPAPCHSLLPCTRLIVQAGIALIHLHAPTEPAAACVSGDAPRVQHLQVCVDADTIRFDVCGATAS